MRIPVGSQGDYWFVDKPENVAQVVSVTTRVQIDSYAGNGWLPRVNTNRMIEKAREDGTLPEDFDTLGYEDEDIKIGMKETVYFAKRGHYRYVIAKQ